LKVLAWKCFATLLGKPWNSLDVQFENVSFHRATVLNPENPVQFSVKIFENSGDFQICESRAVVVSGKIRRLEGLTEDAADLTNADASISQTSPSREFILTGVDVYKDFRLRGYEYSGDFQGILSSTAAGDP